MFTQLNPTIPLHVLERGDGYAIGMIDYGQEHNLIWVTVINATGEIWCAPNSMVRLGKNWTMGRGENPLIAAAKAGPPPGDPRPNMAGEPCAQCAGAVPA